MTLEIVGGWLLFGFGVAAGIVLLALFAGMAVHMWKAVLRD